MYMPFHLVSLMETSLGENAELRRFPTFYLSENIPTPVSSIRTGGYQGPLDIDKGLLLESEMKLWT